MKVRIKQLSEKTQANICYLSKDIFEALGLSKEIQYKIHLGQIHEYSFILSREENNKCIYLASSVIKKLLLPEDMILNFWSRGEDIYLGPVVGVFVNPKIIKSIKKGRPTFSTRKHCEAGNKAHCLCYYFSIGEVDWDKKMIKGYTFIQSLNIWKYDWFPIPNVIYDRGINFKKEDMPSVKYIRQELKKNKSIHFVNSKRYLTKWESHECLSKHPEMNKYLPKTVVYRDFNDVLSMLKKHNFIFIKASGGTHGKQVVSIDRVNGKYKLNFYENSLKEIILEKIEDVKKLVEEFAVGRRFVVQQGIRLLKYNGHIMDLRILMIKNGKGVWQAVQCHSRVAKGNYTITNFSLGGDWISYDEVYSNLINESPDKNIPKKNQLINATRKILYYIEQELGSFGEIGMDIGIDIYGRIWFIEANSRPEKLENESFYKPGELPLSALYIFEYAKYLAKS